MAASIHEPVLTVPSAGLAAARPGLGIGRGRVAPLAPWARSVIHVSSATWSISEASSSASVDHASPPLRAEGGSRSSSTCTRRVDTAGSRVSTP
jgi:hypothetical protein